MITEPSDRRVTRSLSAEFHARMAAQALAQTPSQTSHPPQHQTYARGLSGLISEAEASMKDHHGVFRSSTEEMIIKSLVEGSLSMPAPSMEGIGFTNLPQPARADSEELFNSLMSHGQGQNSAPSSQAPYRVRQASRRLSNELAALRAQQNSQTFNRVDSFDQFLQTNIFFSDDAAGDSNQPKIRNLETENGACTAETSPLKSISWFAQSRPMTRSRSSELRRRYAAMQGQPLAASTETFQRDHVQRIHEVNQTSLPPFHMPLLGAADSVSNVVSMLKGTLERKKIGNGNTQLQHHQHVLTEFCAPPWSAHEELQSRMASSQYQVSNPLLPVGLERMQHEGYGQVQTNGQIYTEGQIQLEGLSRTSNCHPGLLSHAPSPSESSGGAPVVSAGEDPCNSGHTNSNQDFSLKRPSQHCMDVDQQPKRQNSIGSHPTPGLHVTGIGENQTECIKIGDIAKNTQLTRVGSVISSGGSGSMGDKEDSTKKRRVERQRKMAEAKGRNSIPMMPSDLQAALKRCDALEKEVRSLKLNLSFMNRKDSEQTKHIEELQQQNENLHKEKERLLEDMDRLTSGSHQYT